MYCDSILPSFQATWKDDVRWKFRFKDSQMLPGFRYDTLSLDFTACNPGSARWAAVFRGCSGSRATSQSFGYRKRREFPFCNVGSHLGQWYFNIRSGGDFGRGLGSRANKVCGWTSDSRKVRSLTNFQSSFLLPSRQEKLGYNLYTSGGPGTPDQYYAMAGCDTPHNITSRGCGDGPKKNTFHASLGQVFFKL